MQLIAAAEGERRGLYGGAVGYLGYDGNLDTAITIRSAVLKDGQAHVHTGAGIVAGSVPEKEFEETEHKAAALRRAIELAAGIPEAPRPGTDDADAADETDAAAPRPRARREPAHDPGRRQLRQLHVQPRPGPPGGRGGRPRHPQRPDRQGRRGSPGRRSGGGPAWHRHLPGPRRPRRRRRQRRDHRGRRRARDPVARRLPGHAVDGGRVRGVHRPGTDPRPRRGVGGDPRWGWTPDRHAAGVHGRPLSLAGGGSRDAPRCAAGDRHERGGPGRDGHPPHRVAARRRAVPPRERAHAQGPHLLANFLRLAGEGEASLLDDATGSFATAGLADAGTGHDRDAGLVAAEAER